MKLHSCIIRLWYTSIGYSPPDLYHFKILYYINLPRSFLPKGCYFLTLFPSFPASPYPWPPFPPFLLSYSYSLVPTPLSQSWLFLTLPSPFSSPSLLPYLSLPGLIPTPVTLTDCSLPSLLTSPRSHTCCPAKASPTNRIVAFSLLIYSPM